MIERMSFLLLVTSRVRVYMKACGDETQDVELRSSSSRRAKRNACTSI